MRRIELEVEYGLFYKDCNLGEIDETVIIIPAIFEYRIMARLSPRFDDFFAFSAAHKQMRRICNEYIGPSCDGTSMNWFFDAFEETLYLRRRADLLQLKLVWNPSVDT